jgi:hypothetical protein
MVHMDEEHWKTVERWINQRKLLHGNVIQSQEEICCFVASCSFSYVATCFLHY